MTQYQLVYNKNMTHQAGEGLVPQQTSGFSTCRRRFLTRSQTIRLVLSTISPRIMQMPMPCLQLFCRQNLFSNSERTVALPDCTLVFIVSKGYPHRLQISPAMKAEPTWLVSRACSRSFSPNTSIMHTWNPPKYMPSPGASFMIVQGSPVQIFRTPERRCWCKMWYMRLAEPTFWPLLSSCVLILANSMGVQIMELPSPAMKPEAMSCVSFEMLNLLVISRKVSKTVNSSAVATPMKRYIEEAPRQKVRKKPPWVSISRRKQSRERVLLSCSLVLSRSSGMPVETRDQPAMLPENSSTISSSISPGELFLLIKSWMRQGTRRERQPQRDGRQAQRDNRNGLMVIHSINLQSSIHWMVKGPFSLSTSMTTTSFRGGFCVHLMVRCTFWKRCIKNVLLGGLGVVVEFDVELVVLVADALDAVDLELLLPEHLLLHVEQRDEDGDALQSEGRDDALALDRLFRVVDHQTQVDLVQVLLQPLRPLPPVVDLLDFGTGDASERLVGDDLSEGFVDEDVGHPAHRGSEVRVELQAESEVDDGVLLCLLPFLALLALLLLVQLLGLLRDLGVSAVDGWLHGPPRPEEEHLLGLLVDFRILLDLDELPLHIEHVLELELEFQILELLVEGSDCEFAGFGVVDDQRVAGAGLDDDLGRLDVADDHELLHHLLGRVPLLHEALVGPAVLVQLELEFAVLEDIEDDPLAAVESGQFGHVQQFLQELLELILSTCVKAVELWVVHVAGDEILDHSVAEFEPALDDALLHDALPDHVALEVHHHPDAEGQPLYARIEGAHLDHVSVEHVVHPVGQVDRSGALDDFLAVDEAEVGGDVCDVDAHAEVLAVQFLDGEGVVEVGRGGRVDREDHLINVLVQRSGVDGDGCLLQLAVLQVVEAVLVEEPFALSVDGHGLADDLVDVGEGRISVPLAEGHEDVDAGELVQDVVEVLLLAAVLVLLHHPLRVLVQDLVVLGSEVVQLHDGEAGVDGVQVSEVVGHDLLDGIVQHLLGVSLSAAFGEVEDANKGLGLEFDGLLLLYPRYNDLQLLLGFLFLLALNGLVFLANLLVLPRRKTVLFGKLAGGLVVIDLSLRLYLFFWVIQGFTFNFGLVVVIL